MLWVFIRSATYVVGTHKKRLTSDEYPQYMFTWRNKKNIIWIPLLLILSNE